MKKFNFLSKIMVVASILVLSAMFVGCPQNPEIDLLSDVIITDSRSLDSTSLTEVKAGTKYYVCFEAYNADSINMDYYLFGEKVNSGSFNTNGLEKEAFYLDFKPTGFTGNFEIRITVKDKKGRSQTKSVKFNVI